jgi:hypothetical protein
MNQSKEFNILIAMMRLDLKNPNYTKHWGKDLIFLLKLGLRKVD